MNASGFVIKRVPYGESDLILHALLDTNQILHFFAPSARRSKRRFPHQFDLSGFYQFNWNRMSERGELIRLQSAGLLDWKPELSSQVEAWARWSIVLEWMSHHEDAPVSFESVKGLREDLSLNPSALQFHMFFLEQMRNHGVMPQLEECVICHRPLGLNPVYHFQLDLGGLSHTSCRVGIPLSESTIQFLRKAFAEEELPQSASSKLILELDSVSVPFLIRQLDRPMKTQSFLEQIRKLSTSFRVGN